MKYADLNHNFHFVLLSHFVEKGPFHIREPLLCCARSREFIRGYYHPGYREIIIDIKKTEENGIPCGEYYQGGYWEFDIWLDDIGFCKKCNKNLLEYINKELDVSEVEKTGLFKANAQLIQRYYSIELDKHSNK